jgi:hypothetical protein
MSLSDPRLFFGIHSATPYNRTTGIPYGTIKCLAGSSLALNGELVKCNGGSQKFPFAIEEGYTTAEVSLKLKEYPSFLFELFLGKAPTDVNTPDTDGTVSALTNKSGSSVMNASTGIASVIAIPSTGPANLKFGKYVIKATSATAVSIYCLSDVDFNRGTDEAFDDDTLTVATAQAITLGGNTDIASLGLRLTGGSGTIGMTTGDTATFQVQPPFTKSTTVRIGGGSDTFPEFGLLVVAKQRSNGEMAEVDLFRCKASGMPIGFESNAFSEGEVKAEAFFDSAKNGVFDLDWVQPS